MFRYTSIGIIIILITLIPSQVLAATSKPPKVTLLKIEEAIEMGIKVDAGVLNARKNYSQKRTEWKQSLQAIMNEAQKDSGPFARPHNLSKDLSIRMKLPEARKSLIEAKENLVQQQNLATDKVRKLYISTISMMNNVSDVQKKLKTTESKVKEVKTMVKLNKAKQSDVEEAEDARKEAESDLKQAKLSYKSALLDLSKAIGRDVEQGYTFELQSVYADLKVDTIWKLIGHAEKNDITLSSAMMNRSIADEKVKVTRQLYKSKFGSSDMKIIESMFNKEINEELFEANYETFLERVGKQWDGFITILIPFPKSLFQGEFDGIRYFDDQRYSLPVSIFELDKARKKEQDTLEQLLTGIKTSFLSVKTAEETYSQALQALEAAKRDLASAKKKLKVKQINKSQFTEVEDTVNEANKTVTGSYLSYYSAVYKLDLDTSGGIRSFIKKGILPWKVIDDGLSPINASPKQAKPLEGSFAIKPVVDPITSSLSVGVDSSLGATHYQLFTKENIPLTERLQVGKPMVVLQLLLQSITDYQVIFFKQQAPVAQATFEGIGTSGSIAIEKISTFDEKKSDNPTAKPSNDLGTVIIGSFQIALSQLTKEIANVALASVAESGQGMFYKSAQAVDQWVNLEKTLDYQDMISGSKTAIVDKDKMNALKLTVSIETGGAVESLQTPDELNIEINNLKLAIQQLQAQADEAKESGQLLEFAQKMQEIDTSVSKKSFLESLLLGDSGKALSQLAEWSSAQSGEAPIPEGGNQAEILAVESNRLNEQLKLAMNAGNSTETLEIAAQFADALSAQLSEEQGIQQDIEALLEAKTKLEVAYDEAQQSNDSERMPIILEALEAIQSDLNHAQKQNMFTQKQALDLVITQLAEQDQDTKELLHLRTEAIIRIVEVEKLKYDEQELIQLNEEAEKIVELYGEDILPIPVQNVISGPFEIKLDLPPVFANGQAMIQIRPISESFGALVVWNDNDQSVTISKDGIIIICKVGDPIAYVDGQPFLMETYPQLVSGRVVVPLRFVAVSLGIEVDWDNGTQTIELSDKGDIQQ
ncbi:MAG: stalk domain-containing protein [Paenibacillaceae bacterium]